MYAGSAEIKASLCADLKNPAKASSNEAKPPNTTNAQIKISKNATTPNKTYPSAVITNDIIDENADAKAEAILAYIFFNHILALNKPFFAPPNILLRKLPNLVDLNLSAIAERLFCHICFLSNRLRCILLYNFDLPTVFWNNFLPAFPPSLAALLAPLSANPVVFLVTLNAPIAAFLAKIVGSVSVPIIALGALRIFVGM